MHSPRGDDYSARIPFPIAYTIPVNVVWPLANSLHSVASIDEILLFGWRASTVRLPPPTIATSYPVLALHWSSGGVAAAADSPFPPVAAPGGRRIESGPGEGHIAIPSALLDLPRWG